MYEHFQFMLNRLRERLWVKPLIACVLSVAAVLLAHLADTLPFDWKVPEIAQGSLIDLVKIIAASMLGVATFAVASMVAAYGSTGQSATARAFPLVVADDVSQNALSIFIAAFIYAVVALTALSNDYYGKAGRFTLFVMTLFVLGLVIFVFVRWVDRIARLGRLSAVIANVEQATAAAMDRRKRHPCLGAMAATGPAHGLALHAEQVGYLQRIDMAALQKMAENGQFQVMLATLPGALISPARPLCFIMPDSPESAPLAPAALLPAFAIGPVRHFDDDPRFGLVVLSEIASRALSPAVNDPGTAIGILGSLHRLFASWDDGSAPELPLHDRILAQPLSIDAMFDDVIPAIARDGAAVVEVAERLQRVLGELGRCSASQLHVTARRHARLALARSRQAMSFAPDLHQVQRRHADYW